MFIVASDDKSSDASTRGVATYGRDDSTSTVLALLSSIPTLAELLLALITDQPLSNDEKWEIARTKVALAGQSLRRTKLSICNLVELSASGSRALHPARQRDA